MREYTCGKNSHHILNYVKSMMTSIRKSRKKCIGTNVGELTAHVPDVKNWTMSDKMTKKCFFFCLTESVHVLLALSIKPPTQILPEDSRLFILNHDDELSVVHFDVIVHLTQRPNGRDMWARRAQPDTKSASQSRLLSPPNLNDILLLCICIEYHRSSLSRAGTWSDSY